MSQSVANIVKKQMVRPAGPIRAGAPGRSASSGAKAQSAKAPPAAQIVETDPGGALVEVTCGCGEKVYVRCEFPPVGAAAPTGDSH